MTENPEYLKKQLITYLGNKRSLLDFIGNSLNHVKTRLNKEKISVFDVFSGSGVVSRYLKQHTEKLVVNDIEKYAEVINTCYLKNISEVPLVLLREQHEALLNKLKDSRLKPGFISKLYAPADELRITGNDRVFYTRRNAMYLDTARQLIESIDTDLRCFFLAPLLSEASVHANTSGVFKGFYKDHQTGVGKYGGGNGDALDRILGDMQLPFPLFSNFECDVEIHCGDANRIAPLIGEVDAAYLDPPYNQHPYGSNYFMLNLLVDYVEPTAYSSVSGIPTDWHRSDYNVRRKTYSAFKDLLENLKAKFLLISFNSDGFISINQMKSLLESMGKLEILETKYNTFRGSRNLRNRDIHVKEYLYLLEKN